MKKICSFIILYCLFQQPIIAQSFLSQRIANFSLNLLFNGLPQNDNTEDVQEILLAHQNSVKIDTQNPLPLTFNSIYFVLELLNKNDNHFALSLLNQFLPLNYNQYTREEEFLLNEYYQHLLIRAHYKIADYKQVINLGRDYFDEYANGNNFPLTYYYFASALYEKNLPLEFTMLFTNDLFKLLNSNQNSRLRKIMSEYYLKENKPFQALKTLISYHGHAVQQYQRLLKKIITDTKSIDKLEKMAQQVQQSDLLFQIYWQQLRIYHQEQASTEADNLLKNIQNNEKILQILGINNLQKLQNLSFYQTDPYKIGVILPLSHPRFKTKAQEVLQGLEIALNDFASKTRPLELIIKDSDLKPETVQNLAIDLIQNEHVIAILGPLTKLSSLAIGKIAEHYMTPIISFSLTEFIGAQSKYLFRYQRNKFDEITQMVNYTKDYLGARRYIIFYEPTKNGILQKNFFRSEVEKNDGEIAGVVRIDYNQVDFQKAFRRITGTYSKLLEDDDETSQKVDKHKDQQTVPVIDFDAMYIPVTPNKLNLIMSFAKAVEADNTWVLGNSKLNVVQNYILNNRKKIRFLDTYYNNPSSLLLQPFYEKHWKLFNDGQKYQFPTDYTIYAYESLEMLAKLLNDPFSHTREGLRNRLAHLKNFSVFTGKVTVTEDRELLKEIQILRLSRQKTIQSIFKSSF